MAPSFIVASSHLRLQETSKAAVTRPAHAIALLDTALNYGLLLHYDVDVDPDAVPQNFVQLDISVEVFLLFSPAKLAPEAFAAPMAVLGEGTRAHRQL